MLPPQLWHKHIAPESVSLIGAGRLDSGIWCVGGPRRREWETAAVGTVRVGCGSWAARWSLRRDGAAIVSAAGIGSWRNAGSGARRGGDGTVAMTLCGCGRRLSGRRHGLPAGRRNHANQAGDEQNHKHGNNGGDTHRGNPFTCGRLNNMTIVAPFGAAASDKRLTYRGEHGGNN